MYVPESYCSGWRFNWQTSKLDPVMLKPIIPSVNFLTVFPSTVPQFIDIELIESVLTTPLRTCDETISEQTIRMLSTRRQKRDF